MRLTKVFFSTLVALSLGQHVVIAQESSATAYKDFGPASPTASLTEVSRDFRNFVKVRDVANIPDDDVAFDTVPGGPTFRVPYVPAYVSLPGDASADSYLSQSSFYPSEGTIAANAFARIANSGINFAGAKARERFTTTVSEGGTILVIPTEQNARVTATPPDLGRATVYDPVTLDPDGSAQQIFFTDLSITAGDADVIWVDRDGNGIPEGELVVSDNDAVGYFLLALSFDALIGPETGRHVFCYELNGGVCPETNSGIFVGETGPSLDLRSILGGVSGAEVNIDGFLSFTVVPQFLSDLVSFEVVTDVDVFSADCNGDGVVEAGMENIGDLECITELGPPSLDFVLADSGLLRGDLNAKGTVDLSDFAVLSGNFGKAVDSYTKADLNADGFVGFPDFLLLSANFGKSIVRDPVPVPEPSSLSLALSGLALLVLRFPRHIGNTRETCFKWCTN